MAAEKQNRYLDSPAYWFTLLEIARDKRDRHTEAKALRQLERLGVTVRYGRRREVSRAQ